MFLTPYSITNPYALATLLLFIQTSNIVCDGLGQGMIIEHAKVGLSMTYFHAVNHSTP